MKATRYFTCALGLLAASLSAQELTGVFHYRELQVKLGARRQIISSLDGGGQLSIDGGRLDTGGGSFVLSDPLGIAGTLNARLGAASQILIAASTESTGVFSILIGVRSAAAIPAVTGTFRAARLDMVGGTSPAAQTRFGTLDLAAATVSVSESGAGTISDPVFGDLEVQFSADGNHIIGTPLNRDGVFVASRMANDPPRGLYWLAGFSVERDAVTASVGSLLPDALGRGRVSQRANTVAGSRDFRGAGALVRNPDGTGTLEATPVAFAAGGTLIGAGPSSILFAVEAPGYLGLDPFLHPHGVVNAASLSPAGNPVAADTFVSLYGNGFDPAGATVNVNGTPADVIFAAPTQVNIRTPENLSGPVAVFQITSGGSQTGPIAVPLSVSSPAVFTADYSGVGPGMITHADYSLVNAQSSAKRGEIVLVWATGLGAAQPAPRVLIGGVAAEVLFAGAHPEFPGLYQMNIRIPANAPLGNNVPVTLLNAEGESDTVEVAVAP